MTADRALRPVLFPETSTHGFFVHARFGNEQLMTPVAGRFYVEMETALALGLGWINDRHYIDPKSMKVSGIRRQRKALLAIAIQLHDVPQCGVLVARSGFEAPHREKEVRTRGSFDSWWQSIMQRFID
jgi:hypothetical protein